jgi:transaldolase
MTSSKKLAEEMVTEGRELAGLANNVVVKVPMTEEGMIAVRQFSSEGIRTNVTLVFNPLQALLAAKAGATMVSPFVGRLDDIGQNGMEMVSQTIQAYSNYDFSTQVLVASPYKWVLILRQCLIKSCSN